MPCQTTDARVKSSSEMSAGRGFEWSSETYYRASSDAEGQGELKGKVVFLIQFLLHLFIYFWLSWVFIAARGLSRVAASGAALPRAARFLIPVASLAAEHGL